MKARTKTDVPMSVLIEASGLPKGWSAWRSPTGNIFYYNGNVGRFTWSKPNKSAKTGTVVR